MSSFNEGSSDDSLLNDPYETIDDNHKWSQECQLMSGSGSDNDSNDGLTIGNQVSGDNDKDYHVGNNSDDDIMQRHSYDTDDGNYNKMYKTYYDTTDSSVNDIECYSPSKELRRQSTEFRNSLDDYSPSPSKKVKTQEVDSQQWSNICHTSQFLDDDSFSDYSPTKSNKHSSKDKDKYSPKKQKHDKLDKKYKNHGSRKRKREELSSGSRDTFSPDRSESKVYRVPSSGTSLDKPLQGGIGASIMGKMGYQSGKGLGKHSQGRVDPVELSKQKGRQGLGLSIPNLNSACDRWDSSLEVIEVKEAIEWLNSPDSNPPDSQDLGSWMDEGRRNNNISEMADFCDPSLLASVLSCKSVFDNMEGMDMMKARNRSNPFETIRKGIFQNRAAMKMANIDATFDFMFTNPVDMNGVPMVSDDKLLYFADVCAGPGGFSEYVLWRKKWKAKGIGFTLRGENDFKVDEFKSGPPESFEPYYGEKGDGNVFDSDNISDLTNLVMNVTGSNGVHFMMADGGFSVEGQENIQELLSKQLYLCQFLVALSIVRLNGHFVCKLFDIFSPFSVGLVYLMYRCFHKICIFKPNTSRPANSERYIICKWKRHDTDDVRDYMFMINNRLNELGPKSQIDINHCVPFEELQNDTKFLDYIITSNNKLGERQVVNLAKISAFYRDESLLETRQFSLRRECLCLWKVPDKISKSETLTVEDMLQKLIPDSHGAPFLLRQPTQLTPENLSKAFTPSIYDWECVVLGNGQRELTYFLGLGRDQVARYQSSRGRWDMVNQCTFELSPGTLVLGEIVIEYIGKGRNPRKCSSFHIVDAYTLGFENISSKEYNERIKWCELYTEALLKRCTPNLSPVRIIKSLSLEKVNEILESVTRRDLKGGTQHVVEIDDFAFSAKGILFFSSTKEPWSRYKSRSTGHYYYFSPKVKESEYESKRPSDSIPDFKDCMHKNIVWWWEEGVGLKGEGERPGVLHRDSLLGYVHKKINPM